MRAGENQSRRPVARVPHYGTGIRSFKQKTAKRSKSQDWMAGGAEFEPVRTFASNSHVLAGNTRFSGERPGLLERPSDCLHRKRDSNWKTVFALLAAISN